MQLHMIAGTLLLIASAQAFAQAPPRIQTLQLKPAAVVEATPPTLELQTEEARLKRRVAQLERENAELKQQLEAYTVLGGSNVHAYCPAGNPGVSRNTAGAETNCAQSGYNCDPVSGLCRTSCTSGGDECAGGYNCSGNRCRTQAEIEAENSSD